MGCSLAKTWRLLIISAVVLFALPSLCRGNMMIYYDQTEQGGHGQRFANMLFNLAGHFETEIDTADVADYKFGQMAAFNAIAYIGLRHQELPPAFLEDVVRGESRVLWLAANFGQLVEHAGLNRPLAFNVVGWDRGEGYSRLEYQGRELTRQGDCSFFRIEAGDEARVFAYLSADDPEKPRVPYFVADDRLYYLAENPLFHQADDRSLVFADLLHEFFQTDTTPQKRAMVRLEDLAPGVCDLARLTVIANGLAARKIPFSFGVIPFYRDPAGRYGPARSVRLRDDPALVGIIKHMQRQGGALVMHGVTHQHGEGISREDWEFVEGSNWVPHELNSPQWVRRRLLEGLAEFWSQGLDPMIWETPHYAASHGDYGIFAEYFAAFYEKPLVFPVRHDAAPDFQTDLSPCNQMIPYFTPVSSLGAALLPETLGYIDRGRAETSPEAMLARAESVSIVRDGVASFYFHHDMVGDEDLYGIIDTLLGRGYRFVNPDHFLDGRGRAAKKIKAAMRKVKGRLRLWFMRLGRPDQF